MSSFSCKNNSVICTFNALFTLMGVLVCVGGRDDLERDVKLMLEWMRAICVGLK